MLGGKYTRETIMNYAAMGVSIDPLIVELLQKRAAAIKGNEVPEAWTVQMPNSGDYEHEVTLLTAMLMDLGMTKAKASQRLLDIIGRADKTRGGDKWREAFPSTHTALQLSVAMGR